MMIFPSSGLMSGTFLRSLSSSSISSGERVDSRFSRSGSSLTCRPVRVRPLTFRLDIFGLFSSEDELMLAGIFMYFGPKGFSPTGQGEAGCSYELKACCPLVSPLTEKPPEASILALRGCTHSLVIRSPSDELQKAPIIKEQREAGRFFEILLKCMPIFSSGYTLL